VGDVDRFRLVETALASRLGEPAISCACVAILVLFLRLSGREWIF
jgi:hypothetical protein